MCSELSDLKQSEEALIKRCRVEQTHPAVADHRPLPRTQLQDVSAEKLLTPDEIHFQRVELFLKGILVHALEQSNKSFASVTWIDRIVGSHISEECVIHSRSDKLAQGSLCRYSLSKTRPEFYIGARNDVCEANKLFTISLMAGLSAIAAALKSFQTNRKKRMCRR